MFLTFLSRTFSLEKSKILIEKLKNIFLILPLELVPRLTPLTHCFELTAKYELTHQLLKQVVYEIGNCF